MQLFFVLFGEDAGTRRSERGKESGEEESGEEKKIKRGRISKKAVSAVWLGIRLSGWGGLTHLLFNTTTR